MSGNQETQNDNDRQESRTVKFDELNNSDDSDSDDDDGHFIIPNSEDELWHARTKYGANSWRFKLLQFTEMKAVQMFLLSLLVLDIVILFAELFIAAEFPTCLVIERDGISCCPKTDDYTDDHHRWLASSAGDHGICEEGIEGDYQAGCDAHKYQGIHDFEFGLFCLSMVILSCFLLELVSLIICLGPKSFFSQAFYTMDIIVVSTSWVLELSFHLIGDDKLSSVAGVLIIARLWRFIRIGHGIVEATVEMASKKHDKLLEYAQELEELLEQNQIDLPETDRKIARNLKGLDHTLSERRLNTLGGSAHSSDRRLGGGSTSSSDPSLRKLDQSSSEEN